MIDINMFRAVRNISYIDTYTIEYVPTFFFSLCMNRLFMTKK